MTISISDSSFSVFLSDYFVDDKGVLPLEVVGREIFGYLFSMLNVVDHNSFNEGEYLTSFDRVDQRGDPVELFFLVFILVIG